MKVSILIPVHNGEKLLGETILCALNQTWPDKEIIIVDDGSTDNSLNVARSFESGTVKVFTQQKKGASAARNLAFENSNGSYIQYLDADDLLSEDKIAIQMEIAKGKGFDPDILIFGKTAFFMNNSSEYSISEQPLNKSYDSPVRLLTDMFSHIAFIASHAYLVNRELIKKAGAWDEQLSSNDDGEFFARVICQAKKVVFSKEGLSLYRRNNIYSLSHQKSRDHILSEFHSLVKTAECILNISDTTDSRASCSRIFNWFIVEYYPDNSFILKETEREMKRLKLTYHSSSASRMYRFISQLAGWRRAVLFSEFYSGLKRKLIG